MATKFLEPGMDATQDGSFFVGLNVGTGSTAAYDSSQAHAGTGSMKCVVTVSGQTASPFTPDVVSDAGSCISAWFRFSTVTPATITSFLTVLTSANGSGRMGLGLNTNGTINFANKGSASQANGSTTLVVNTWYRISLSYTDVSTSTWAAKVYINGTLEINASAGVQGNGSANSTASVSFGQNASSLGSFSTPGVSTVWVDSMYIDNRTDLTDCGNIDVTAKRPNANGTTTGFTTQIGSGGSGYGSGHAPQVNERPLSTTNGWSMIGAGSAITEEYTIESASAGDVDISAATIKDYMGWVYVKALASETASIIVGGSSSNISVTTSNAAFTKAAGSASYPAGGTDIGVTTSTTLTTFSLYECGVIFAYIPASGTLYTQSLTASASFTGAQSKSAGVPQLAALSFTGSFGPRSIVALLSGTLSFSGLLVRAMTLHAFTATLGSTGSFLKSAQLYLSASLGLNNIVPNGSFENAPNVNTAATTAANVWINGATAGSSSGNTYGWATISVTSSASAGFDSTQQHSGTYSMKLSTLNSTGQMTVGNYPSSPSASTVFPLMPSTKYTLTGWIKTNNVVTNGSFIDVREYNAALGTITTTSTNKLAGTNGWTQVTSTFTTNASTASGSIFLRNNLAGNVSDAWFDDIVLQPSSTSVLLKMPGKTLNAGLSFTGNIARAGAHVVSSALSFTGAMTKSVGRVLSGALSFTGVFNAVQSSAHIKSFTAGLSFTGSSSKQRNVSLRASVNNNNIVPNGGFELIPPNIIAPTGTTNRWVDGTTAGSNDSGGYSWGIPSLTGTAQVGFDSTQSHSGGYSLKLSTLATSDGIVVGNYKLTPSDGVLFPMKPLTSYTLTAWIKTNNVAASAAFVDVREYTSALGTITTTSSTKLSGTNGWTQVTFTWTTNNTTAFGNIFLRNNVTGNIGDAWFDDITLAPAAPTFIRAINHTLTAALLFTGAIAKLPTRALTATLSFAGAFARNIFKLLPGYLGFIVPPDSTGGGLGGGYLGGGYFGQDYSGSLGSGFTKTTLRSIAASIGFVGSISRGVVRSLTASLSFTGKVTKTSARTFAAGTLSFAGIIARTALLPFSAALSFTGAMRRVVTYTFSAGLSFTGTMNRAARRTFQASVSFIGSVIYKLVYVVIFGATVTFVGAIGRTAGKSLSAVVTYAGSLGHGVYKGLVAGLNIVGRLNKSTTHTLQGVLSATGSLVKTTGLPFAAVITFTGSIVRLVRHSFTASLSSTGKLGRTAIKSLQGSVSFVGSMFKRIGHILTARLKFRSRFFLIFKHRFHRGRRIHLGQNPRDQYGDDDSRNIHL